MPEKNKLETFYMIIITPKSLKFPFFTITIEFSWRFLQCSYRLKIQLQFRYRYYSYSHSFKLLKTIRLFLANFYYLEHNKYKYLQQNFKDLTLYVQNVFLEAILWICNKSVCYLSSVHSCPIYGNINLFLFISIRT